MATAQKMLLTLAETAEALCLSEKTVWLNTAPRGELVATRIGRSLRYSPAAIERFIESRERTQ